MCLGKKILLPLCIVSFFGVTFSVMAKQADLLTEDVKRIVFIGDSITYDGRYVSYVEAYLRIIHPKMQAEFINVGLPSETASGLSEPNHANGAFPRPDVQERLDRVLTKLKPDLVFSNYGINDGIYMPFEQQRFDKYRHGIERLHQQIIDRDIALVHIAPPIFDKKHDADYAEVMHKYADWLLSKRQSHGWQVIDGHWPMQRYLDKSRQLDDKFYLAKDGIHPNATGHGIIAMQILNYLGESPESPPRMFDNFVDADKVLQLVSKKQVFLRNAWLSETGHTRPNIDPGMSIQKALLKSAIIERKLVELVN